MAERYTLPRQERILRSPAEDWKDFLWRHWPGGSRINLKEPFAVTEEAGLGYRRFIQGEGDKVKFELLLADEAADILQRSGKGEVKRQIKKEIAGIAQDPFGQSSIDPSVGEDYLRQRRSVNKFSAELEAKLGLPLAMKGSAQLSPSDPDREDLIAQFRFMKQRQNEWQDMPEHIKRTVRVCKVYAAMRYPVPDERGYEEWLIMERIPEAKQVTNDRLGTVMKMNMPERVYGFAVEEDPLLAEIVERQTKNPEHSKVLSGYTGRFCYQWSTLQQALQHTGLHISDLDGRNILYTDAPSGQRQYVLVDQRDRTKEKL